MIYNIKILVEYDGTNFHGWQRQAASHGKVGDAHPTIQGILEDVLTRITKEPIKVTGAGRTDTGVHATGQVANLKSTLRLKESSWVKAINSLLPPDIIVKRAEYVPIEFHARYSAKSKIYQYLILNSDMTSQFLRNYVWHVKQHLNIPSMKEVSDYLIGTHDFSSFRASDCSAKSPVKTLDRLEITEMDTSHIFSLKPNLKLNINTGSVPTFLILFTFEARSYLQHMVRNIVGTLVEAGKGKLTPVEVKNILEKKDRRYAGPIAPSHGLFLVEVRYS